MKKEYAYFLVILVLIVICVFTFPTGPRALSEANKTALELHSNGIKMYTNQVQAELLAEANLALTIKFSISFLLLGFFTYLFINEKEYN